MSYATPSTEDVQSHYTFVALMNALSRPGTAQPLPLEPEPEGHQELTLIGRTLLDLETSYWAADPGLEEELARTGARALGSEEADYLFLPELSTEDLPDLGAAKVGTMLQPDRSATIIIGGCSRGGATTLRLRGPGIDGERILHLAGLPKALWALREQKGFYPVGWDILLVCAGEVVGLPRSTTIDVE